MQDHTKEITIPWSGPDYPGYFPHRDLGISGYGSFWRHDDQITTFMEEICAGLSFSSLRKREMDRPAYGVSSALAKASWVMVYDNPTMNAISTSAFSDGMRLFIHRGLFEALNNATFRTATDRCDHLAREWIAQAIAMGARKILGLPLTPDHGGHGIKELRNRNHLEAIAIPPSLSPGQHVTWVDPKTLEDAVVKAYAHKASKLAVMELIGESNEQDMRLVIKDAMLKYADATKALGGEGQSLRDGADDLIEACRGIEGHFIPESSGAIQGRTFFQSPRDTYSQHCMVHRYCADQDEQALTDLIACLSDMSPGHVLGALSQKVGATEEHISRLTDIGNRILSGGLATEKMRADLVEYGTRSRLGGLHTTPNTESAAFEARIVSGGLLGEYAFVGDFGPDWRDHYHRQRTEETGAILIRSGGSLYPDVKAIGDIKKVAAQGADGEPATSLLLAITTNPSTFAHLIERNVWPLESPTEMRLVMEGAAKNVFSVDIMGTILNKCPEAAAKVNAQAVVSELLANTSKDKSEPLEDLLVRLAHCGMDLRGFDAAKCEPIEDQVQRALVDPAIVDRAQSRYEHETLSQTASSAPGQKRSFRL